MPPTVAKIEVSILASMWGFEWILGRTLLALLLHEKARIKVITAAIFVSLLFGYALISRRASQTPITAPILFTAAGMVMSSHWMHVAAAGVTANVFLRLAELGLVLLLFTDASQTDLTVLRSIGTLPCRLLSTGMFLTILLGGIVARLVFPGLSIWEAGHSVRHSCPDRRWARPGCRDKPARAHARSPGAQR